MSLMYLMPGSPWGQSGRSEQILCRAFELPSPPVLCTCIHVCVCRVDEEQEQNQEWVFLLSHAGLAKKESRFKPLTVGSSPYPSSPTTALNIAFLISIFGLVIVSLRNSISRMIFMFSRWEKCVMWKQRNRWWITRTVFEVDGMERRVEDRMKTRGKRTDAFVSFVDSLSPPLSLISSWMRFRAGKVFEGWAKWLMPSGFNEVF